MAVSMSGQKISLKTKKQGEQKSISKKELTMTPDMASVYDFKVLDINGNVFDFSSFKGKKMMIVNTASECGFTPQYEALQRISEEYKDKLVIVGFPSNDFGEQEPGSDSSIISFCQKNYGVRFPMMSKITVTGKQMHPLYQYLTNSKFNKVMDSTVKWNFQKYLINEKGQLERVVQSSTAPNDQSILDWIKS